MAVRTAPGLSAMHQHATVTTGRDVRPSVALVVSPTLCPCRDAGQKRSGSRDHDDKQAE